MTFVKSLWRIVRLVVLGNLPLIFAAFGAGFLLWSGKHTPPTCSPGVVISRAVSPAVLYPDGVMSDNFADGQLSFYLFIVHDNGTITTRKVSEIQADYSAPGTVVSCQTYDEARPPSPASTL